MNAPSYRQVEFAAIGSLDQDLLAGLNANVIHRGALQEYLPFFGRPGTVLLPDAKKTLVVVIVQCIQGQVTPGFALAVERDSQSKCPAPFCLVHLAHVADGG